MEEIYKDYKSAEVTVFWTKDNLNNESRLILATTELIPKDMPSTLAEHYDGSDYNQKIVSDRITVFTNKFLCTVEEALIGLKDNHWSHLQNGIGDIIACSEIKREPQKGFAVVLPKGEVTSTWKKIRLSEVLPDNLTCFRACAYLDIQGETIKSFSEDEQREINRFVSDILKIDLEKYFEFWGSRIFYMRNPILEKLEVKISDDKESYQITLYPYKENIPDGLKCSIQESHVFGMSCSGIKEITTKVFNVSVDTQSRDNVFYLWDKNGSLLETIPIVFITGKAYATFQFRTLPNQRRIPVWPKTFYTAYQENTTNILKAAEDKRVYEYLRRNREFCYFKAGETDEARDMIGEILSECGLDITICDPYLDKEALENKVSGWIRCNNLNLYTARSKKEDLNAIKEVVDQMVKNEGCKSAKLYILYDRKNKTRLLHDRFVITEKGVWCLGTSLNHFGCKDTVLYKSPNPKAFIDRVNEWNKMEGKSDCIKLEKSWQKRTFFSSI